jgi:hypothetical protein
MSGANARQVGGTHYQAAVQHWDIVVKWHVPYLEAQVMRYVTRCHKKNKRQDLEKALHFAEKMHDVQTALGWLGSVMASLRNWFYPRSLATGHANDAFQDIREYAVHNNLDPKQELICWMCVTGCDPSRLVQYVRAYMQEQYPQEGDPLHRASWVEPTGRYVDQGNESSPRGAF